MTKTPAAKRKPDDQDQSRRFIEMARQVEASETEKGATRAFKKVVPAKPAKSPPR